MICAWFFKAWMYRAWLVVVDAGPLIWSSQVFFDWVARHIFVASLGLCARVVGRGWELFLPGLLPLGSSSAVSSGFFSESRCQKAWGGLSLLCAYFFSLWVKGVLASGFFFFFWVSLAWLVCGKLFPFLFRGWKLVLRVFLLQVLVGSLGWFGWVVLRWKCFVLAVGILLPTYLYHEPSWSFYLFLAAWLSC